MSKESPEHETMKIARPLRVFVAEDHALVREGLVLLINTQSDMEVVGEAGDGESAWRVLREVSPDVAVLDVSLPQLNGAQVAARIKTAYSHVKILGLSAYGDAAHVRAFVEAGASGYVLKHAAAHELTDAIRTIANGGQHFAPELLPVAGEEAGQVFQNDIPLTPREVEVVRLVAWGYSNKDIAARLHVSSKTVEGYKTRLFEKLGLGSRVELVRYALKRGWLNEEN
ncbi:oxygen regulatory protein NreC [Abditibacteriota bacterium]|nr:oxygen regulatory protein NreC [Abditibacteriota bacterium]